MMIGDMDSGILHPVYTLSLNNKTASDSSGHNVQCYTGSTIQRLPNHSL